MKRISVWVLGALLLAAPAWAQSDLLNQGQKLLGGRGSSGASSGGSSALTNQQADSGLREALKVATQRTVSRVGKPDGYLKDSAIHIPLPSSLESAKKTLDAMHAGGTLDDLETRTNRAAEAAAPKAYDIFADAVSKMSVSDAKGIITGPNDAATQYLKRTTTPELTQAFRPIVDKTLSDVGALKLYQQAEQKAGASSLGGVAGMVGGNKSAGNFDFTGYVVGKALDGLFHYIAQEEAAIRTNPVARSTDLLKQVFGH